MDLNANQVESIVRQVLTQMGGASAPKKRNRSGKLQK